jgi:hypothetical protein
MAHEVSKPVRKTNVEMLEAQLNRLIMFDNETPHGMFNWLKKLVSKARAPGSKKWTNLMLTKRLMMAYTLMIHNVVALIRQDPAYKKMTSDDVLGRIMNHEMNIQEANNINNLYMGVLTSKKQDAALKATNKSKKKKSIIESPSEEEEEEEDEDEEEYDEEEMALFIKKVQQVHKQKKTLQRRQEREAKIKVGVLQLW